MTLRSLVDELIVRSRVAISPDDRKIIVVAIQSVGLDEEALRNPGDIFAASRRLSEAERILRKGEITDVPHDRISQSLVGFRHAELIDQVPALLIPCIDVNYWTGDLDSQISRKSARYCRGFGEKSDRHFYRAIELWVKKASKDRGHRWAYRRARIGDAAFRTYEYTRDPSYLQLARELLEPLKGETADSPDRTAYIINRRAEILSYCASNPPTGLAKFRPFESPTG